MQRVAVSASLRNWLIRGIVNKSFCKAYFFQSSQVELSSTSVSLIPVETGSRLVQNQFLSQVTLFVNPSNFKFIKLASLALSLVVIFFNAHTKLFKYNYSPSSKTKAHVILSNKFNWLYQTYYKCTVGWWD